MANRLLPFRQYNEHFVINLFRLKLEGLNLSTFKADKASSGAHDAGVLVKVSDTSWAAKEPAGYEDISSADKTLLDGYLGAASSSFPHVAHNAYPAAVPTMELAGASDEPLGVTLRQTLAFDENGEKLLYYRQKLEDLYGVLPGEVVPVLTKGIITVAKSAVTAALTGDVFAAANGKFAPTGTKKVGRVLGVGDRSSSGSGAPFDKDNNPDYFAGDGSDGAYYIINLDL